MSDFLSMMLAGEGPQAREVSFVDASGKRQSGTVHFRRITAGERQRLLQGQRYVMDKAGGEAQMRTEIDLSANEAQKHLLVSFSVCHPDGTPAFKNAAEVAKLEAVKVNALFEAASAVNSEVDAGKD